MTPLDPTRPRALSLWLHGALATALAACPSPSTPPLDTEVASTDEPVETNETDETDTPAETDESDSPVETDESDGSDSPDETDESDSPAETDESDSPDETDESDSLGETDESDFPVETDETDLIEPTDEPVDTAPEDTDPCTPGTDPNTLLPQALTVYGDTGDYTLPFFLERSGCEWPEAAPTSDWQSLCRSRGGVDETINPTVPIEHLAMLGYMGLLGYLEYPDFEIGAPCGDAANVPACRATYEAEVSLAGGTRVMASTDAGAIRIWDDRALMLDALGVVDTTMEASILVWSEGEDFDRQPFSCAEGRGWVRSVSDGYEVVTDEYLSTCPVLRARARLHVAGDGTVTVLSEQYLGGRPDCIGRPPPGLRPLPRLDDSAGDRFARHAAMEAASAFAFRHLIEELIHHGAPSELLVACERAARDEERHARLVGRLALREGVAPRVAEVERCPVRSLLELALDNAVVGCVGETLGALAALAEAAGHADPVVAATLRRIGRDEVRHAALSWRLHRWLCGQLPAEEQATVQAALRGALEAPEAAVGEGVSVELGRALAAAAGELALAA
jgi:hypothetical protein